MSLRDDSGFGWHDGWYSAALVFAAGIMAATLLMSASWPRSSGGDAAVFSASNSRTLVILPQPLR